MRSCRNTSRRCGRGRLGVVIACLAILTGSYVATAPIARADVVLIDFDDAAAVSGWTTVNDPVMGGRSTSQVGFGEGGLVFSGSI